MTDSQDDLRRKCWIEPEDGPFMRELKAILMPPLPIPDLVPEPLDLASGLHEAVIEPPDVVFKRGDSVLGLAGATNGKATRNGARPQLGDEPPDDFADSGFDCHDATISRLLSPVKRAVLARLTAEHLQGRLIDLLDVFQMALSALQMGPGDPRVGFLDNCCEKRSEENSSPERQKQISPNRHGAAILRRLYRERPLPANWRSSCSSAIRESPRPSMTNEMNTPVFEFKRVRRWRWYPTNWPYGAKIARVPYV